MSGFAEILRRSPGRWFGLGEGEESGPFVARIDINALPGGGVAIDYEAMSREQGIQHREHSLLVPGQDGDRLIISHTESPVLTELQEDVPGGGRFVQGATTGGPYAMSVVIALPEPDRMTSAWWWAPIGETPTERSCANVRYQEF